jgi:DNA mismatch repair protein MSH5
MTSGNCTSTSSFQGSLPSFLGHQLHHPPSGPQPPITTGRPAQLFPELALGIWKNFVGLACLDPAQSLVVVNSFSDVFPELPTLRSVLTHLQEDTSPPEDGVRPGEDHPAETLRYQVALIPHGSPAWLQDALKSVGITAIQSKVTEFDWTRPRQQLTTMWPERNLAHWGSQVRLENRPAMMALSALLCSLSKAGYGQVEVLEGPIGAHLLMEPSTHRALQVIKEEQHPGAFLGIGVPKEGLSLLGLFLQRARTPSGRSTLRRWLAVPSADPALIEERLNAIECFTSNSARETICEIISNLKVVYPVSRIFQKFDRHSETLTDWESLLRTTNGLINLKHLLLPFTRQLRIARQISEQGSVEALLELSRLLTETIDFQTPPVAALPNLITFKRGVDPKLDELRDAYGNLDTFLTTVAQQEVRRLPPYLQFTVSAVFFPQLGYLLSVPVPHGVDSSLLQLPQTPSEALTRMQQQSTAGLPSARTPASIAGALGLDLPDQWNLVFASDTNLYCKNAKMMELDEKIGDIHAAICDRTVELVRLLKEQLKQYSPHLLSVQHCGSLDAILAMAAVAVEEQWVRPVVDVRNPTLYVQLVGARHPLLSHYGTTPVPFDFALGSRIGVDENGQLLPDSNPSFKSCCVLTGANGSGKSVLMKSVALIVYLAHIGSFVPAHSATVGLCHHIAVNDGSHLGADSPIELLRSSFANDASSVARMIHQCNGRSLLLLDEFGKGTLADDGIALLASTVDHLATLNPITRPLSLVATHFTELFTSRMLDHVDQICTFRMAGISANDELQSITHLFQPTPIDPAAITACSRALSCALANGLPPAVVKRASIVADCLRSGHPVPSVVSGNESSARELLNRQRLEEGFAARLQAWMREADRLRQAVGTNGSAEPFPQEESPQADLVAQRQTVLEAAIELQHEIRSYLAQPR